MADTNIDRLLPTTVVGSYAQPDWLIDREALASGSPPRVRRGDLWRVDPRWLEEAQNDATILAIRAQERAGIDIITDGEARRESYSNLFSNALDGIDRERTGTALTRMGKPHAVPLVTGPIRRTKSIGVRDVEFLRANTDRTIKATLPGPFTMSEQAEDAYYKDPAALAMAYAEAANEEIRDLFAVGADIVQIDEPFLQARPDNARAYAIPAINRALEGVGGTTALHLCMGYAALVSNRPDRYHFLAELADCTVDQVSVETGQSNLDTSVLTDLPGKTIILGVLDLKDPDIESPETVAARIERALPHVPAEKIVPAPDCGMKYLPRATAYGKLAALAEGARIVREKLTG
jgi:5-methyltetrahydropteroyltriglutamate--homocysteine methyltransferase